MCVLAKLYAMVLLLVERERGVEREKRERGREREGRAQWVERARLQDRRSWVLSQLPAG